MRTERYTITVPRWFSDETDMDSQKELLSGLIADFIRMGRETAEETFSPGKRFMYTASYALLTQDDIRLAVTGEDTAELRLMTGNIPVHVRTSSAFASALSAMLRKMTDCPEASAEYVIPEVALLLLGPVKQPDYCHEAEWFDEDSETVRWYHSRSTAGGYTYPVGSTLIIDSYRTEVYGTHAFYDEDEMCEFLDENYPDIKEI